MSTTKTKTKAEAKILATVKRCNDMGALAGLVVDPEHASYNTYKFRFVKRLAEKGEIVWVPWTPELGAGWVLACNLGRFTKSA
jgi:type 1 glutamine amidotransferase